MARPTKKGLDYFPLDVDIFEDEKIEAIAGEFGYKGELAVIKLLCAVYKKGYYILWDTLTQATLQRRTGLSNEMLEQIINRLVLWGFFDEELFNSVRVLTSAGIQARYFEATKRRKTSKPFKYIIDVNNNSQENEVNDNINTQTKVKESKVNKSKENNNQENGLMIQNIYDFYTSNFGIISPNKTEQLRALAEQHPKHLVLEALKAADNYNAKNPIGYAESILNTWARNNVKTLEDIEALRRQKKSDKIVKPVPQWHNESYVNTTTEEERKQLEIIEKEMLRVLGEDK